MVSKTNAFSMEDLTLTAVSIAKLQLPTGMIPWFIDGHCDPWNHIETAMALDVAGLREQANQAYRWLAKTQSADGSWPNYFCSNSQIEDSKLDSNVCAYIGTGLWHHWLCTNDEESLTEFWPMLDRAMSWVMTMQRDDGTFLWAREPDATPWDYALLTGCCSIRHALVSATRIAAVLGHKRPNWLDAAAKIDLLVNNSEDVFEPKRRWAMDWYYPVLTGVLTGTAAKVRLSDHWESFVLNGHGVRCVSDEPWVTASETAECAMAYAAVGDIDTASSLLWSTSEHRTSDGSYLTGLVYPGRIVFPPQERTAYTGAAVILAADSIYRFSPGWQIFRHDESIDS